MVHGEGKDKLAGSSGAILTRRNLLELAGLAFASTAFPPGVVAAKAAASQNEAAQGVSPVMDKLSKYMSEASERALPDEVVEKAKHHILDTLAAMISGSEIRPGRAAIEFVRAYGGKEVATVVASNIVCGPIEAALAKLLESRFATLRVIDLITLSRQHDPEHPPDLRFVVDDQDPARAH